MNNRTVSLSMLFTATRVVAVLTLLHSAQAAPVTYAIKQEGWTGGGVLNGRFSGEDRNADGHIKLASGEVNTYEVTFSGNTLFPDFTHIFTHLQYFDYTVGATTLPPGVLRSANSDYFYDADDYMIGRTDWSLLTEAFAGDLAHPATVTVVPEPVSALLYGAALVTMLTARNRTGRDGSSKRCHSIFLARQEI